MTKIPAELEGLTAVVTGSSSGIGRAMALELARAGANVLIHFRRSAQSAAAVADEVGALGRASTVAMYDLAEPGRQEALVAEAWLWRGAVDIWINNAGVDLLTGPEKQWSYERKLEELLRVDVTATIRISRMVGEKMKARGSGVILNLGWDQAQSGMAGESGQLFAAAKGAIIAFSKSLALSLAPQVRVNCLAPGWIKTSWGETASESWQLRAVRESALNRWGTPEDVAHVARFLASPAASFLTGQTVIINGGWKGGVQE